MNKKTIDKAASALMKMGSVEHKRPRKPTKKDLERKFKMEVDRKGKSTIQEVS